MPYFWLYPSLTPALCSNSCTCLTLPLCSLVAYTLSSLQYSPPQAHLLPLYFYLISFHSAHSHSEVCLPQGLCTASSLSEAFSHSLFFLYSRVQMSLSHRCPPSLLYLKIINLSHIGILSLLTYIVLFFTHSPLIPSNIQCN